MSTNNTEDDEIVAEYFNLVRIYKSGRVERTYEAEFLPPGLDTQTNVMSKDIAINPTNNVVARLYIPNDTPKNAKLPILVYYHGGGFCIETAFSPLYHPYMNSVVAKANIVGVSIDYRRMPEYPLPAAYDDCWEALEWVGMKKDDWLSEHGDFDRVFLAGDSAGGNIVHNMAMRVSTEGLVSKMRLKGIALVQPYFWGSIPVPLEERNESLDKTMMGLWKFLYPSTVGIDDPLINPLSDTATSLVSLTCKKVLVYVAGKDFLRARGRAYYEKLKEVEWKGEAEISETDGEDHVFHLIDPTTDRAIAMMKHFVAFLNSE